MRHHAAHICTAGLLFALLAFLPAASAADVLTNAAQIRALSPEDAAKALPVKLNGIVIMSAAGNAMVVQTGEEAIYVNDPQWGLGRYRRGDRVEISGVTDPGGFAPVVTVRSCRKIGTAPLPTPIPVTFDDLTRKHFDAQFVEITGIVRMCEPAPATNDMRSRMIVSAGGKRLWVRLHRRLEPGSLVDAEVRLRGFSFGRHTAGRQFLSPLLDVPPDLAIEVLKPAPSNPWNTPSIQVADLMKFAPQRDYGHRVRVRGIVTSPMADGTFSLRDGSRGLRISSEQLGKLEPGDMVDVIGFPSWGDYLPALEDATYKKISATNPPAPILVTNLIEAVHQDADLIELEAMLTGGRPVQNGWALTLAWKSNIVEAVVALAPGVQPPASWQPGSRVRVAGICSAITSSAGTALSGIFEPTGFSLQLRSTSDLTVLEPPPWWTPAHISQVLGAMAGALLLVTGVVFMFARRRLNEQKRQRAMAEAEFSAILAERNRLAREIHDTLAQGLAATSVQLRLARKKAAGAPESLHQHLDTAQQLVSGSLQEARNSIWNMRSQVLETGDLASALRDIFRQMADGTDLKTSFEIKGRQRRLAPMIEGNLLRVGQEAITNAFKHAQASEVKVQLEFGENQFRLLVSDNGRGFDPSAPPQSDGGFGLVGMRERAAELKGDLIIRSVPGQGTEVVFSVPVGTN